MCVMVANQGVEDHSIQQPHLRRAGPGHAAQQGKALGQARPALVLVLQLGHHAQRLTKVFLMQTLQLRLVPAFTLQHPVIALHQQNERPSTL